MEDFAVIAVRSVGVDQARKADAHAEDLFRPERRAADQLIDERRDADEIVLCAGKGNVPPDLAENGPMEIDHDGGYMVHRDIQPDRNTEIMYDGIGHRAAAAGIALQAGLFDQALLLHLRQVLNHGGQAQPQRIYHALARHRAGLVQKHIDVAAVHLLDARRGGSAGFARKRYHVSSHPIFTTFYGIYYNPFNKTVNVQFYKKLSQYNILFCVA